MNHLSELHSTSKRSARTGPGTVLLRRLRLTVAATIVATAVLAACTNNANSSGKDERTPPSSDSFPVTVSTVFGDVTIPAKPTRIVSAGVSEQDALWGLGLAPVGVTEWYGEYPSAAWPWATNSIGLPKPQVLTTADGFQFEAIASLKPDLIIAINAGTTEKDFQKLSKIAPTITQSGSLDFFEPWEQQATTIGAAVGKSSEIATLISQVKDKFKEAKMEHPEFVGKKVVFLQNAFYDGSAIAYQAGLSTAFLTDLGFVIPDNLSTYAIGDAAQQATIPKEDLVDALDDADVLVWATESPEDRVKLEKDAVFQQLRATKEGRNVFTGGELSGAIYFSSVLSLPYVVDNLTPLLADALTE